MRRYTRIMVQGARLDTRNNLFFDPLRFEPFEVRPEATSGASSSADKFGLNRGGLPFRLPVGPDFGVDTNPATMARALSPDARGRDLGVMGPDKPQARKKSKMRRRWDHYAKLVRDHGGKVCPGGKPTVLGLRNIEGASTRYGDRFVVLRPDHTVRVFRGSTHPGQSSSSAATDANGDGAGDVGTLRPGNYSVVANGPHDGKPSYHVRTLRGSGSVPGFRDTNHDGHYSASEKRASRRRGDKLTEILFHVGLDGQPSSIGCMNVPPETYDRFVRALGGSRQNFSYTLVNA